jgi:uncharacterized protein YjiS (DUF1127 family)
MATIELEDAKSIRRIHMTVTPFQPCADCPPVSRRHAGLDALNEASDWVSGTLREWRRRIRARSELAELDDRMLQDIGLTHADREFLVNKPFWRE